MVISYICGLFMIYLEYINNKRDKKTKKEPIKINFN